MIWPSIIAFEGHLDGNAGGPVHAAAWEAFAAACASVDAPAQIWHPGGRWATNALAAARAGVAAAIGAVADDIVFVSGGTEADALALATVAWPAHITQQTAHGPPPHIVCSGAEHAGIRATLAAWQDEGRLSFTEVHAGPNAVVPWQKLADAITPQTRLVTLTLACNETGALQPVAALSAACRARGVLFHTDAVQAVGRVPVNVGELGIDMLSLSAHKLGGTGGTGALYVHPRVPLRPLFAGPAAANVPGAAALAAALTEAGSPGGGLDKLWAPVKAQRDAFEAWARRNLACRTWVVGGASPRLPNTSCMGFAGCRGDDLAMALDLGGFAASTGSACSSGQVSASPRLLGMGYTPAEAREVVRFSWTAALSDAAIMRLQTTLQAAVARASASSA